MNFVEQPLVGIDIAKGDPARRRDERSCGARKCPERPLISVVIPHLNQPEALEACLGSLDAQSLAREFFEIVVVDNGSVSLPEDIIANHSGARLLRESQAGPGPARNFGVRSATGDVIAFIDADCRAHRDWLRNALQTIRFSPEGTVLGGDVRIWRSRSDTFTGIEAYEAVFSYRFKLFIEQHGYCGTGNLVVRRADYEKVGPFAGIEFAEDVEWGQRARAAGLTFRYIPEMVVFHPARRSLQELYAKWDRHTQHELNMARGKHGWKTRWIARALAVLASPVVHSVEIFGSDRIQGVSSRLRAISVLFAIRAYRARKMLSLLGGSKALVWNRGVGNADDR
jgi:glycosyltransferase involved in cell wall biosynthesis